MAKKKASAKTPEREIGGPFLAAAFFCDQLLQDNDKTLSAIRIIDTVTVGISHDAPEDVPSEEHRVPVVVTGLLSFRAGDARGTHRVRTVVVSPSGKQSEGPAADATFGDSDHAGWNLNMKIGIGVSKSGLFWFKVYVGDVFYTQIPLTINIVRAEETAATPAEKPAGKRVRRKA